jgi:hypothetical protein
MRTAMNAITRNIKRNRAIALTVVVLLVSYRSPIEISASKKYKYFTSLIQNKSMATRAVASPEGGKYGRDRYNSDADCVK